MNPFDLAWWQTIMALLGAQLLITLILAPKMVRVANRQPRAVCADNCTIEFCKANHDPECRLKLSQPEPSSEDIINGFVMAFMWPITLSVGFAKRGASYVEPELRAVQLRNNEDSLKVMKTLEPLMVAQRKKRMLELTAAASDLGAEIGEFDHLYDGPQNDQFTNADIHREVRAKVASGRFMVKDGELHPVLPKRDHYGNEIYD